MNKDEDVKEKVLNLGKALQVDKLDIDDINECYVVIPKLASKEPKIIVRFRNGIIKHNWMKNKNKLSSEELKRKLNNSRVYINHNLARII